MYCADMAKPNCLRIDHFRLRGIPATQGTSCCHYRKKQSQHALTSGCMCSVSLGGLSCSGHIRLTTPLNLSGLQLPARMRCLLLPIPYLSISLDRVGVVLR